MLKKNKGITLVALVVTIIVLIILAGISINLLFGDNGIIKKAQDVSGKYKEAANEENIKLSDLDERMRGILGGDGSQGGSGNGNGNDNPVTPPEVTGPLGTPVNTNNYGNIVYNYTAQDLIWRLFYEDSNNIYLISETNTGDYPLNIKVGNYENGAFTPLDSSYVSGESVSQQGKDLMPLLGGATSSSVGTNSNGTNLLISSNTKPNIWGTAYLCDTRENGPWEAYKTGPASWAMGGPTIELFAASYNATHNNHQIVLGIGSYGYTNNTNGDWISIGENHGIYRLKTPGWWWLASPSQGYYENYVGLVNDYNGYVTDNSSLNINQARPVVCISKSTGFICQFEPTRTGVLGAPLNTDKYGRQVTNYTAADLVWRLFYEDSNNIYLISETQDGNYPLRNVQPCNYTNNTYSPKDVSYVSGESVSQQGKDLMLLLGGATTSSAGTVTIGTNSNGTNLLTSSNTNPNIWATAYLCDTRLDGPWSVYKTGKAAWAMGGPTIELFTASYNSTHINRQISLEIGTYGYTENLTLDWFSISENYGIYRLKNNNYSWFLSSPSDQENHTDYVKCIFDKRGRISESNAYFDTSGMEEVRTLRPVVCIQKSSGFTYELAPES